MIGLLADDGAGRDRRCRAARRDQRGRGLAGLSQPYTEAECPLALDGRQAPAAFDRYYFPAGDGKAVYVDTVTGRLERAHQEAEKRVDSKRRWCEKRGVEYMVVVEDTVTV